MPKVSIGLPLYNGGTYLEAAISSLLAQTFTDFELVLVDNASTDRSGEICRAFAARDRRVRYHRNERNIGGGPNQNLAYDLVSPDAPYFKWAAHDDMHAPDFLEKTVAVLDKDPGVVLAFGRVNFIDPDGKEFGSRHQELPVDSPDVLVRFEALFGPYDCLEMFGLMRRSALPPSPILGLYADGDGVFLARLALRGRFTDLPDVLFYNRRHPTQATTQFKGDYRSWASWWNPALQGRRVFPIWRRNTELWRSMLTAPLSARDQLRCARALARWTRWTRRRMYDDVAFHVKDVLRSLARPQG